MAITEFGRLALFLDAVDEELCTLRPDLFRDDPCVKKLPRGRKELGRQKCPPSVVWVPLKGNFEGAEKTREKIAKNLYARKLMVGARIWAADYDAVDALIADVVNAVHTKAWGIAKPAEEEWTAEEDADLGVACVVVFEVTLRVPRKDRTRTRALTLAADTTGSAKGDGYIDWSEPT